MTSEASRLQLAPDPPLGARVKMRREAQGLSQAKLGERIHVSQQTIATWENGGRPESRYFTALRDFLDLSSEEEVVAILDAHDPRRRSQDAEPPTALNMEGLTARQALDLLVQTYATQVNAGNLTDAQSEIYATLTRYYTAVDAADQASQ
jgi:transcriptional regulator with XRE-family HTH domain